MLGSRKGGMSAVVLAAFDCRQDVVICNESMSRTHAFEQFCQLNLAQILGCTQRVLQGEAR